MEETKSRPELTTLRHIALKCPRRLAPDAAFLQWLLEESKPHETMLIIYENMRWGQSVLDALHRRSLKSGEITLEQWTRRSRLAALYRGKSFKFLHLSEIWHREKYPVSIRNESDGAWGTKLCTRLIQKGNWSHGLGGDLIVFADVRKASVIHGNNRLWDNALFGELVLPLWKCLDVPVVSFDMGRLPEGVCFNVRHFVEVLEREGLTNKWGRVRVLEDIYEVPLGDSKDGLATQQIETLFLQELKIE